MKKVKNQEVKSLYLNEEEKKKISKKNRKAKKPQNKQTNNKQENDLFNFDTEIVIGIKKTPAEKKKGKTQKKKTAGVTTNRSQKNKDKKKKKTVGATSSRPQKSKPKKNNNVGMTTNRPKNEKKKKRIIFFVKCMIIITILIGIVVFLLLSPLFNILYIKVENNSKVRQGDIIELSGINLGDNLFLISSSVTANKIKKNPYIESVSLQRNLPDTLIIKVKERKATYALQIEEAQYAYINNQGYILEINAERNNLPLITSYTTQEIVPGGRLNNEDLEKIEIVLRVMETANGNQMGDLITSIDIKDKKNIILRLEGEKKTIYIGDGSDINTKMLYIKATLEDEKGVEGELFMDGKTNKEGEFLFREKV